MSDFMKLMKNSEMTRTENGASAYRYSGKSPLVDLTFGVSACRGGSDSFFDESYHTLKGYMNSGEKEAIRSLSWLLYLRDIRKGMGERNYFRKLLVSISNDFPELTKQLVFSDVIQSIGRFDDLVNLAYYSKNDDVREYVVSYLYNQFKTDYAKAIRGKHTSLLGKWLPSCNSSSYITRGIAKFLYSNWGISAREYRKKVSTLRKNTRIVESLISDNKWDEVEYSKVPSKANLLYKDAFLRHSPERRMQYLEDLVSGKETIHSGVLMLYEIVSKYRNGVFHRGVSDEDTTLEEMWKSLGSMDGFKDTMVVRDGSGSMLSYLDSDSSVTCMDVGDSIALYCSENLKGSYKDKIITFSRFPKYVDLSGYSSLRSKLIKLMEEADCSNTDLKKVFELVLDTAKKNNLSSDELPKTILVVSDMQFDYATSGRGESLMDYISRMYREAGYSLPRLVFWNVGYSYDTIPMQNNEKGVLLISGFSKNLVRAVSSGVTDMDELLDMEFTRYHDIVQSVYDKAYKIL